MTRLSAGQGGWGLRSLVAGCVLVTAAAGCGSPVSDKPAKSESRVGSGKVEDRAENARPLAGKAGQDGAQSAAPTGSAGPTQQEGDSSPSLTADIPPAIAKDLGSPDARDRYRALDYWETKGNQASLDPVFDAMEDDDPAVRAKATAIVEQYWAAEQEREKKID